MITAALALLLVVDLSAALEAAGSRPAAPATSPLSLALDALRALVAPREARP